jgi:hypothetical protein
MPRARLPKGVATREAPWGRHAEFAWHPDGSHVPGWTTELAGRLGPTAWAVSQHLTVLRGAVLARTYRPGVRTNDSG